MADQQIDHISIQIDKELGNISPKSSKSSIFKVPNQLRQINEKAYDPEVVAIGPYHYGKDLHMIKQLKLHYLQKLLQRRREEKDVRRYVKAMWEMKEEAHNCYEQPVSLNNVEFVEMMLFDACFIVELVRKNQNEELRDEIDHIFQMSWLKSSVQRDLLLVENQIPFFVLRKLFDMTKMPNQQDNLTEMVLQFFDQDSVAENDQPRPEYSSSQDIKHILSLLRDIICHEPRPSGPENEPPPEYSSCQGIILSLLHENICTPYEGVVPAKTPKLIGSAIELHEAGIKFNNGDAKNSFDVKFENGTIEIPVLRVEDGTESRFRNFIAYEQHDENETKQHVTNYINFMDCIINSPKDVELLREKGIIENWLGDDNVVASMFNKLGDSVIIFPDESYDQLFNDINDHCSKSRHKWMANLRHNYFNSPWALISFLAASLLLLMTLVQTLFSVLAYFQ